MTFFAQNTLNKASSLPGAQSLPIKRLVCELDISSNNIAVILLGTEIFKIDRSVTSGAPNEDIVQNHLNIALLNAF